MTGSTSRPPWAPTPALGRGRPPSELNHEATLPIQPSPRRVQHQKAVTVARATAEGRLDAPALAVATLVVVDPAPSGEDTPNLEAWTPGADLA